MRKRLLGSVAILTLAAVGVAHAASSHHAKPVPRVPPPPVDPWTGFYVGGNVGYSWGRSSTTTNFFNGATGALLTSTSGSFNLPGVVGGGQIGYNQLNGNWLWGLETDFQGSGERGNANSKFLCAVAVCQAGNPFFATGGLPQNPVAITTFNQKIDWFGTVRGRVGVVTTPAIVAYVTGGLAYGEVATSGTITGQTGTGAVTATAFNGNTTKAGWTLGGGVEGRLSPQWSAKVEYLYMDLGTVNNAGLLPTNFIPIAATFSSRVTDSIVRFGLNYKYY
jgi:outer membrane immunogenic protein